MLSSQHVSVNTGIWLHGEDDSGHHHMEYVQGRSTLLIPISRERMTQKERRHFAPNHTIIDSLVQEDLAVNVARNGQIKESYSN